MSQEFQCCTRYQNLQILNQITISGLDDPFLITFVYQDPKAWFKPSKFFPMRCCKKIMKIISRIELHATHMKFRRVIHYTTTPFNVINKVFCLGGIVIISLQKKGAQGGILCHGGACVMVQNIPLCPPPFLFLQPKYNSIIERFFTFQCQALISRIQGKLFSQRKYLIEKKLSFKKNIFQNTFLAT